MGRERKGGGGKTSSWLDGSSHPFPFLALPRHVRAGSQDKSESPEPADRQTDRQTAPLTESQPSPAAAARGGDQGENMDKGAVPSAAKVPVWMRRISRGKSEGWGLWESVNKEPGREVERGSCEGSRRHLRAQIPRGEADLMASNSLIALFP